MKKLRFRPEPWAAPLAAAVILLAAPLGSFAQVKFAVSFPAERSRTPVDGRVLLLLSTNGDAEPRFQINDGPATQLVFGIDVEGLAPGADAAVDASAFGYPLRSLAELPAGEYYVQALLHRYETFRRSDGHTVKLPMDRGEGQRWNAAPGNLYSAPRKLFIDPGQAGTIRILLDKEIPPIAPPKDTKYIRHEKIKSDLLSEFWGRPMHIGACLLLPEGFDEHPEARYPLVIFHGHFPYSFDGFRETPPDPNLEPDYSERFHLAGYNRIQEEYAHAFYKEWTGKDFPRVIIIEIQHANPYYDDSYAVNSANLGPYGDAIVHELIPYIEKKYRGLGQGWARFLYGGSTGGWEALAAQVFYPDAFNGCYACCPDPIDFRAYTIVNIYEHRNAYFVDSPWKKTPRPALRNYLGEVSSTLEETNHRELALGTHSRSGDQWDIWQAVFGPVGGDGYPKPIWDKLTGEIDREVADYWKENYDLVHILQRDWKTLGPKLEGKIHIYVGDMDNYYLNNAVYLADAFLESTKDPYYAGDVDYGDRAEHCWNGDHDRPNAISRLRYHQMYIPRIVKRIEATAPKGADLKSWRY
ncbi:MAG TPA: alpha/beta hydrolase-fold protein [Candidatus Latescibacteria bacterium]|nr:alpha/beta hydrolase-fold protein [Candidatus Latescibacterota bacterium]